MPNGRRSTIFPGMTETIARDGVVSLTVNGERREIPRGWTLSDLLGSLELHPQLVVVEHNRTILRDRARYASLVLGDGDVLEIVHFVGGG